MRERIHCFSFDRIEAASEDRKLGLQCLPRRSRAVSKTIKRPQNGHGQKEDARQCSCEFRRSLPCRNPCRAVLRNHASHLVKAQQDENRNKKNSVVLGGKSASRAKSRQQKSRR